MAEPDRGARLLAAAVAAGHDACASISCLDLDAPRSRTVLARLRSVPPGFVTTYGDLSPGAPRFAGAVLSACGDPDVPWQRAVRADGSLAKGERQRRLLEREGVPFQGERVDMRRAWAPPQAER